MAKLKETIAEARGGAPAEAPADAAPPAPEHVMAAELDRLRAENEALRGRLSAPPTDQANRHAPSFGTRPLAPAVDPAAQAQPAAADRSHAVGEPGPGKSLWLVHLPGHKSRVVDRGRGVALLVAELPVWATNKAEAWQVFADHSGICSTTQQPRVEPFPGE